MGKSKKLFDKISDTLGLYEEDEVGAEEEAELVEEEEGKTTAKPSSRFQRTTSQAMTRTTPKEVAPASVPETKPKKSLFAHKNADKKTINMPLSQKQIKVVVIEPTDFNDSQKVADYLRTNQPVVVNFETTDRTTKKRMTDFIYGTIYALSGSIKQIGNNILVCAPKNVDIDADTSLYGEKGGSKWTK